MQNWRSVQIAVLVITKSNVDFAVEHVIASKDAKRKVGGKKSDFLKLRSIVLVLTLLVNVKSLHW
jgi:hypothetical protein